MKIIFFNLVLGILTIDSTNILLREIDTYGDDKFSYIVNDEIKRYHDTSINIYVSILENYDNWIEIDNESKYSEIYNDVFGVNKTFLKRREYENQMLIEKIVQDDVVVYIMRNHFAGHFGCDLNNLIDLTWLQFYDINIANCKRKSSISSIIYSNDPIGYIKEDKLKNIFKLNKIESKRKLNTLMDKIISRKVN
jgi:hypothetical protein